jgi:Protein of unknown function (DUF1236)
MRVLLLITASLALVASAGLALAQPHERGPGGPGAGTHGPTGPSAGGDTRGPGAQAPGAGAAPRGELKGSRGYNPEPGNRAETPRQRSEPNRRAEPETRQRTEPNRRAEPQPKTEPNRRAEPQRTQERQRATEEERRATDQNRADRQREQQRNADRERTMREQKGAEERRRGEEQRRAEERRPGAGRLDEGHRDIVQARTRLSMQDRERLHRSFNFERARISRVDFDHHMGARIPRRVHLFPMPREVIGFFPYYRDYSYFVVDDEICIVNPRTYEVVDVIDQGYWRAPGRTVAGLQLSSAQIALVRDSIPRDFPEANVRLRLALGADIPDRVELYDFPQMVLDRVRELREFRFLVTDEQIVIVDPHDRSIALVIDRV